MSDFYTVSQITEIIAGILEGDPYLSDVKVIGEIADLKIRKEHVFFNLVEEGYRLPCVFFGRAGFVSLREGEMVEVEGSVGVYRRGGYYSFRVQSIRRLGRIGLNTLKFERTLKKLVSEGIFPREKKKLPVFPMRIGLIASKDSAAYRDVLNVFLENKAAVELHLFNTGVQGENAKYEMMDAMNTAMKMPLDVLLITRGGGSKDDLWIFNDEDIIRKVLEMEIPVVTGIGHSTDRVLLDLIADFVRITPTAAAQLIVERQREYEERLQELRRYLEDNLRFRFREIEFRLRVIGPRLRNMAERILSEKLSELSEYKARLESSSPLSILEKGFAIVLKNGKRIPSVKSMEPNDELELILKDGSVKVRVYEIRGYSEQTRGNSSIS